MSKPARLLVKEVARIMDTSNVYAQRMINAVIAGILREIIEKGECSIFNFGLFYTHRRKSYVAPFDKNVIIPPKIQISFRPSKSVKKLINSKSQEEQSGEQSEDEDREFGQHSDT